MLSKELLRNGKAPSAFDIPTKSVARALQHDRSRANQPLPSQHVTYATKAQDMRTQQIKRVAI